MEDYQLLDTPSFKRVRWQETKNPKWIRKIMYLESVMPEYEGTNKQRYICFERDEEGEIISYTNLFFDTTRQRTKYPSVIYGTCRGELEMSGKSRFYKLGVQRARWNEKGELILFENYKGDIWHREWGVDFLWGNETQVKKYVQAMYDYQVNQVMHFMAVWDSGNKEMYEDLGFWDLNKYQHRYPLDKKQRLSWEDYMV